MKLLNVFITVDTEVWPLLSDWDMDGLARDVKRDIYAETPEGEYGLRYQMDMLNRFGLKGVFFVEPLFAEVAGKEVLTKIISEIQSRGHEVQAHLHPEWLQWMKVPVIPNPRQFEYLKDFSEEEQTILLEKGIEILRACGSEPICAFRAGDFAANASTLRALANCGVAYDTSYNHCYLRCKCGLSEFPFRSQPFVVNQVQVFPVSFFSDFPGHYRHVQLCACSSGELQTTLLQAWRNGFHSFVLVSHSFELLKRRRANPRNPRADWTVIRRFENLCRFLAANPDKFRTSGFTEIRPHSIPLLQPRTVLRTGPHRTLWRWVEQSIRRVV